MFGLVYHLFILDFGKIEEGIWGVGRGGIFRMQIRCCEGVRRVKALDRQGWNRDAMLKMRFHRSNYVHANTSTRTLSLCRTRK